MLSSRTGLGFNF